MKGLLVKDFRLLEKQKRFFLIMVLIALGIQAAYGNTSFLIGYITSLSGLFVVSTISYDEFDNGNAFLFTLPISREEYVREKYVFGLVLGGGVWLLSAGAVLGYELLRGRTVEMESCFGAYGVLLMAYSLIFIMIPVYLKFGREKAGMAMFGGYCVIALAVFLMVKAGEAFHMDVAGRLNQLAESGTGTLLAGAMAVCLLLGAVSYRISVGIMAGKEL